MRPPDSDDGRRTDPETTASAHETAADGASQAPAPDEAAGAPDPDPDPGLDPDIAADPTAHAVEDGKRLEFEDAVEVRTTTDHLWSVLSDPATLTECVPGAESFERVTERKYTLAITRGVSHLTVSLSGAVEFVEMDEPEFIVASGFAHDTKTGSDFDVLAAMEMTELDPETVELSYRAEVSFTGGVASLGPKLLRPIVRRDVDTYFENVRSVVERDAGGATDGFRGEATER